MKYDLEELKNGILSMVSKHIELPEEIRKQIGIIYVQLNELMTQNRIYSQADYKILEEGLQNSIIKANEIYRANGEKELEDIIYLLNKMQSQIESGEEKTSQGKEEIIEYYQDEKRNEQVTERMIENINQEIKRIRARILNRMEKSNESKENMNLAEETISGFLMMLKNNSTERGKIEKCIREDKNQLTSYIEQVFLEYEIESNKTPHQKFAESIRPQELLENPNINNRTNIEEKHQEIKTDKKIESLPDNVLE